MYGAGFVYYSYWSMREASGDINVCRLTKWGYKYMNCSESHFTSIWPFHLSKTILMISYTHRNVKVFTASRQNKSPGSLEVIEAEIVNITIVQ